MIVWWGGGYDLKTEPQLAKCKRRNFWCPVLLGNFALSDGDYRLVHRDLNFVCVLTPLQWQMKLKCSLEKTVFKDSNWKGCQEDLRTSKNVKCQERYPELEMPELWDLVHPARMLLYWWMWRRWRYCRGMMLRSYPLLCRWCSREISRKKARNCSQLEHSRESQMWDCLSAS